MSIEDRREQFEQSKPKPPGIYYNSDRDTYYVEGFIYDNREPIQSEELCETEYNACWRQHNLTADHYEKVIAEKVAEIARLTQVHSFADAFEHFCAYTSLDEKSTTEREIAIAKLAFFGGGNYGAEDFPGEAKEKLQLSLQTPVYISDLEDMRENLLNRRFGDVESHLNFLTKYAKGEL